MLILHIVTINIYISFKINFVSTTNFFKDLSIVRISQTYRLSWYIFFCLFTGTYTGGYWVKVCYRINYKLWIKYCSCWHCDDMIFGLLIPILISVYLHKTNIFCVNNQFNSSYNFSTSCCVFPQCICPWCEHYNIKIIGWCVYCVYGYIFTLFD